MRQRILITGPGGRVGTQILPLLREHFALRLFDSKPLAAMGDDELVAGDIREFETLRRACDGVGVMVHLAAISDEDDFHSKLLPVNVAGVYNAFEAARQAGVKKVLFASTGQTVVNYPKGQRVATEMPVRPCTVYACTKVFGEALARHYSDNHGLSMVCLRICYFRAYDDPLLRISGHAVQREWCSPRDLTQLMVKCIGADIRFGIFFAISNNRERVWDISDARAAVGYEPQDDAADYLPRLA